jgi:polysaccharide pyruvyl transferase WcaK-like protein
MYVILHAFSRRNAGDGLLVDLTLDLLAEAGIDRADCVVLALDPHSFADFPRVERAPGEARSVPSLRLIDAAGQLMLGGLGRSRVDALVRGAKGLVAVGGGYLVADGLVRQAGVILNHLVQLHAAAKSRLPSIYLPQSIGPLDGMPGALVRRQLRQLTRVYVRDDQTLLELSLPNCRRCADLAVLKLSRTFLPGSPRAGNGTAIVARHLPRAGDYDCRMLKLADALPGAVWAVQADVPGPRSDRTFYSRLGIADAGHFDALLRSSPPAVVVSVRLHGAIAALLAGVPAIHLSYERKGWGAYEDLGLGEFVHDARSFDPALVAAQAQALAADPGKLWTRINAARSKLNEQHRLLVSDLRHSILGTGPEPPDIH